MESNSESPTQNAGASAEAPASSPQPGSTPDLSKVIEQSTAAIAEEIAIPPRGRGRPKGSKTRKGSARGSARPGRPVPPHAEQPQPDLAAAEAAVLPPEQDLTPIIGMGIKTVFDARAEATGFPGWHMDDQEAERHATLINGVLSQYAPKLAEQDPKLFTVCFAAGSIGFAVISRVMAEKRWRREKKPQAQPNVAEAQGPGATKDGSSGPTSPVGSPWEVIQGG